MDEVRYRQWFPKVKDLIWNDLSKYIDRIEREGHIPHDEVIPKLAALGLYGCLVPESHGGLGLTVKQYVPVLIELSKMYAGLRGYLHAHVSASKLLEFATDEYFKATGATVFYPEVFVTVASTDSDAHLHVPLLLSPFGYSTYKGT